jgi:hypothetical protein
VEAGAPIGRVDERGAVVVRAFQAAEGRARPVAAMELLPQVAGADDALRDVVRWWRELHGWLRGEDRRPRTPLAAHAD